MIVTINLEETYDLVSVEPELTEATFNSCDKNDNPVLLKIMIKPLNDPFLSEVYNLSFGPPKDDGTIDDDAKICHQDSNKVFSTIILFALVFLTENSNFTIGVDGSNDVRAYMYHRMFLTNRAYLREYFLTLGVDWCVRLLRNWEIEKDSQGDPFWKPRPELFDYQRNTQDLYRYYMFHMAKKGS
jgi:hypothetical protein